MSEGQRIVADEVHGKGGDGAEADSSEDEQEDVGYAAVGCAGADHMRRD